MQFSNVIYDYIVYRPLYKSISIFFSPNFHWGNFLIHSAFSN